MAEEKATTSSKTVTTRSRLQLKLLKLWRDWARPFLIVVAVGCSLRSAVADWNDVPTGSMKPTILEGDRIFVNKLAYDLKVPFTTWRLARWGEPARGEIVVLYSPADGKRLVKRVIAVPGDRVELRDNQLFVNGEAQPQGELDPAVIDQIPATEQPLYRFATEKLGEREHPIMLMTEHFGFATFGPATVPAGQYFVMGDNRDNSNDSRRFGFVDRWRIVGRASAVAISVDPKRYYAPRWSRFFQGLP